MGRRNPEYIFVYREKKGGRVLRIFLIMLLLVAATFFLLNYISCHHTEYQRRDITIPNLPEALEGFSILHISDLHGWKDAGLAQRIASLISGKEYSCVVFTGDMLGRGSEETLLEIADLFPPDLPRLLIPGDEDPPVMDAAPHASLSAYSDWAVRLQEHGIVILDEPFLFERGINGQARLWIVPEELYTLDLDGYERVYRTQLQTSGGEDMSSQQAARQRHARYQVERIGRIREKVAGMREGDIQIALTHIPLTEEYVRTWLSDQSRDSALSMRRISLVLAGHYTGGAWRLPWGGALYVPDMGWFPEDVRIQGMGYPGGIRQYISPGLGKSSIYGWMWGRMFNPQTVTSLELTRKMKE